MVPPILAREAISVLIEETVQKLREMRLSTMARAYVDQTQDVQAQDLTFEERLGLLVDHEWTYRRNRRQERFLREAHLRLRADPDAVDYHAPRGLDKGVMRRLLDCAWIPQHHNVTITGPTGVGKTFLACALGVAACRHGYSVRYHRLPRLLTDLTIARGDGSYPRLITALAHVNLLILDDWGLADLSSSQGRDLLDLVDERSGRRSTLVASQLPFDRWHAVIQDPTIADAVLDRLIHDAYPLVLKGESLRKKNSPSDSLNPHSAASALD